MDRPNTLLKVVSIIYIVISAIAILFTVLVSAFFGTLWGSLVESVGAGVLMGGGLMALMVCGSVLSLAAGIVGVKGAPTGSRVFGIILLVAAVLNVLGTVTVFDSAGTVVGVAIARLVLPVLYTWGAFKGPRN